MGEDYVWLLQQQLLEFKVAAAGDTRKSDFHGPSILKRGQFGAYRFLLQEIKASHRLGQKNFIGMDEYPFSKILNRVASLIQKENV